MDAPTSVSRSTDTVAATPPASTAHRARGIGMSRLRYWANSHPLDGAVPPGNRLVSPVAAMARLTMSRRGMRAPPSTSKPCCTKA